MKRIFKQNVKKRTGSVLVMAVIAIMIMTAFGIGMLAIAYGTRQQAIQQKNEAAAMLAAEAGYEKAVFWMSQQRDMLTTLYNGSADTSGEIAFTGADCNYEINFHTFINSRPVFRIVSNGHSGQFNRTVDTLVVQAISGWAMGMCRIPVGTTSTNAVNFATGEIIDMPLHINKYTIGSDTIDIHISGTPSFLQPVSMGESRYTAGGADKYGSSTLALFNGGISFNQPDSRISDEDTVQEKINRFAATTASAYKFTPTCSTAVSTPRYAAVQLEFFVDGGVGKVRITNNCTVDADSGGSRDYEIVPGTSSTRFRQYNIYNYHYKYTSTASSPVVTVPITDTYVTQSFSGIDSEPGGQIYVKGNVIIGGADTVADGGMLVKGKITVVAEKQSDGYGGHIWIADSIKVDGYHDMAELPEPNNQNVLGLIAQGCVKVVNPTNGTSSPPAGLTYQPIGITKSGRPVLERYLPDPVVVEAAIVVGGGGWGAENVGSRREYGGTQDDLVVRGAITESCRGAVGTVGTDGFIKKYYLDKRLLEGILPGDIGLQGKYIPAPAGWHDYRN